MDEVAFFGVFVLLGFVVGLLVGRWWALLLAALVPVAYVPAGEDADGAPEWAWALILLVPFAALGIAAGVTARRAWRARQRTS